MLSHAPAILTLMKKPVTITFIACVLVTAMALSGCVTTDYSRKKKADDEYQAVVEEKQALIRSLDSKVGLWTIDDAMIALGPYPSRSYGDTVIICTWSFFKSYYEDVEIGGWPTMTIPMPRSLTRYYQLTFDKEKHVLIHYKFWVENHC